MVDVVVLGASPNRGPLREISPVPAEALIPIGSKAMVAYVLEALLGAAGIGRITLVGPEAELAALAGERVRVTAGGTTAIESLQKGLRTLPPSRQVLVATADLPLLTPEAVDGFLAACREREGDVFYPLVPRDLVEARYPGVKRTYVRFREGVFTGGNLFLINPAIVDAWAAQAEEMVRLRKSPLQLARLLGMGFIFKLVTRTLSLREVEAKVSQLFKIQGHAVVTPYPEIGLDVDKPSDYQLVRKVLEKGLI